MTPRRLLAALLGVALGAGALIYGGYNVRIGLDPDDSENLETTRVLAAARQFSDGPGALYGPYSGANPCVLIQAPLYYRLTALLAWPLVASGVDSVDACFASGRSISFLSFLAALAIVARLARLDGGARRVGAWAALIAAGTPLVGSYPVTMRPDMLGVALQTGGLALVLRVILRRESTGDLRRLLVAYSAFALAFCVKQHYIIVPAFCSALLIRQARLRRVPSRYVVAAHATSLAVVVLLFGAESLVTSGMLVRSAFEVPRRLQDVTAGCWGFVRLVFETAAKRSVGLVALGFACLVAAPRRGGRRLDALLMALVLGELALMVKLCLDSSGGWYNYALQSALIASALLARSLDGILAAGTTVWRLAPICVAALVVVAADVRAVGIGLAARRDLRSDLRRVLTDPRIAGRPAEEIYFAGPLQPFNRRLGRRDLAHDEWLYGAFEAVHAAEPRADWLQPALVRGPVRLVVVPADGGRPPGAVAGLDAPLPALGFDLAARHGPLDVWERR